MIKFAQEAYTEFTKVTWPTKQEAIRLTGYVMSVSLLVSLFVATVDYLFTEILSIVLQ